jgi:hypothetical protein
MSGIRYVLRYLFIFEFMYKLIIFCHFLSGTVEDGSDLSPFVSWHQLMNRQQNKHGLDGKEWFQRLTYVHLNVHS